MTPSAVVCGRCGATNPQDAEFCESCGALMAAYQAPAGATNQIEALTRSAEETPHSETIYVPPTPPVLEVNTVEPAPELLVEERVPAPEQPDRPTEPEKIEVVEPADNDMPMEPVLNPNSMAGLAVPPTLPIQPEPYLDSPPLAQTLAVPQEQRPPAPEIFKKVFGEYAEDVYYPTEVPGARRTGTSPQSLILLGVGALVGVCLVAAAASSSGTILLLVGGPLACSLIAVGVLLLVGRYPTGRP